jgi:hypothetical protein
MQIHEPRAQIEAGGVEILEGVVPGPLGVDAGDNRADDADVGLPDLATSHVDDLAVLDEEVERLQTLGGADCPAASPLVHPLTYRDRHDPIMSVAHRGYKGRAIIALRTSQTCPSPTVLPCDEEFISLADPITLRSYDRCVAEPHVVLSRSHQQVLAFVGAYLHGYQCLPTAAEVARASGLRSSRTAGRLLKDLEDAGLLERDARYRRLGYLRSAKPATPVSEYDQLWLCELGCVELTSNLEALRVALDFPLPASTIATIHSEGVSRALELEAYQDLRARLADAGITLREADRAKLEKQRRLCRLGHQLLTDWDAYCIVRLIWMLSALDWLCQVDPLPFGYVGTCFLVSHRTYAALLPTYRERAAGPLTHDERAPMPLSRLGDLLTAFRQEMADHTPVQQPSADVDISALLAV